MALESGLQEWLHTVEQGALAKWVIRVLIATTLVALSTFWLMGRFNGFSIPEAMDQAQIGRQIAFGQGYTTLYARPLALNVLAGRGRLRAPTPEVNNAPLGPFLNATVLRVMGKDAATSGGGFVFFPEVVIAAMGIGFLLCSLLASYWLGCMLFERRTALLGTGLLICTTMLWKMSTSGLPQAAMLMLFNAALLVLLAALKASAAGVRWRTLLLAWLAAFLLGLTTLGNGVALWLFPGFLLFAVLALRPWLAVAAGCIAAYALPLLPWAWHNWRLVGNPFGFAWIELRRPAGMDALAFAAELEPRTGFHWIDFFMNTATQTLAQVTDIFSLLGHNVVAAAFFLAVVCLPFRSWRASQFRWVVLLMWLGAFAGMSVAGVDGAISVNQLHVLFLPVMVFYGLSFLLELWEHLGLEYPAFRTGFLVVIYAMVAAPLLVVLGTKGLRVNWPPYLPMLMARFPHFIEPGEAISSDIPWATAWYSNRRSLLLPRSVEQLQLIDSERLLAAPVVAVYITPASGDQRAYADILNGRYRDWARLIFREAGTQKTDGWALGNRVTLPVNGMSLLFADKPRWKD